jgi:hypothetical protein
MPFIWKWQFFKKNLRSNDFFNSTQNRFIQDPYKLIWSTESYRSNDLSVKWPFFEQTFSQKNFRSNDLSVKWSFSEKAFGQMNFRSNDLVRNFFSVKWHFLSKVDLVKWPFSEKNGQMNFRSNGTRSNGFSVKIFQWNDFSVKSRTYIRVQEHNQILRILVFYIPNENLEKNMLKTCFYR